MSELQRQRHLRENHGLCRCRALHHGESHCAGCASVNSRLHRAEEDIAAHLQAAFEEGDPSLVAAALGDIAHAKGMAQIARDTGRGRESLYKALSSQGNPEFATLTALRAEAEHFQVHHQPQKLSSKLLPHQLDNLDDRPL